MFPEDHSLDHWTISLLKERTLLMM